MLLSLVGFLMTGLMMRFGGICFMTKNKIYKEGIQVDLLDQVYNAELLFLVDFCLLGWMMKF